MIPARHPMRQRLDAAAPLPERREHPIRTILLWAAMVLVSLGLSYWGVRW